jgi:hypothetical protein
MVLLLLLVFLKFYLFIMKLNKVLGMMKAHDVEAVDEEMGTGSQPV